MDRFIGYAIRLLALLLAALAGWWIFPDDVLDLSYLQWFQVVGVAFVILGFERASDYE